MCCIPARRSSYPTPSTMTGLGCQRGPEEKNIKLPGIKWFNIDIYTFLFHHCSFLVQPYITWVCKSWILFLVDVVERSWDTITMARGNMSHMKCMIRQCIVFAHGRHLTMVPSNLHRAVWYLIDQRVWYFERCSWAEKVLDLTMNHLRYVFFWATRNNGNSRTMEENRVFRIT